MSDTLNNISLLSKKSTGGIIGSSGYSFQTHYIASCVPNWISIRDFTQLIMEGTGDADVRFQSNGVSSRVHIQVKNHEISPSEFREVIDAFKNVSDGFPGANYKFVLASPSLSRDLRPLENVLTRYRGAKPFFSDVESELEATKAGVVSAISKLGLFSLADFILEKVSFDTGLTDFHQLDKSRAIYVGNLMSHTQYRTKPGSALEESHNALLCFLDASLGKTLNRDELIRCIENAVDGKNADEDKVVLTVHNWTKERFPFNSSFEHDWSSFFDRDTRKVPGVEIWGQLQDELAKTKKAILDQNVGRHIVFQGKVCLSTGIMIGQNFPINGGWAIDVFQPQVNETWSSASLPKKDYSLDCDEETLHAEGDSLVFICDITGRGKRHAVEFIKSSGIKSFGALTVSPKSGANSNSINNEIEAVSFGAKAIDKLRERMNHYSTRKVHLFYYGPISVALFLGQRLTSLGTVTLYEFQEPGYVDTLTLKT